jgi:hypothetical protein
MAVPTAERSIAMKREAQSMPADGLGVASQNQPAQEDEFVAAKKAMWSRFIKFSTWAIVGVAVLLIGMLLFLV